MRKGFTLTEILISLMVIAIILAVSIPVITHNMSRRQAALTRPWNWVENNGVFNPQSGSLAVMGTNNPPAENAPILTINANTNTTDYISFYNNDVKSGSLNVNNDGTFLGSYNAPSEGCKSVVLGRNTQIGVNSVAIGNSAIANNDSVAIGFTANTVGANSVAIGAYSYANSYAIALGDHTKAQAANSIAIGSGANAVNEYSVVLGSGSYAINDCYVIGRGSGISKSQSILIAHGTEITSSQTAYFSAESFSQFFQVNVPYDNDVILGSDSMYVVFDNSIYSNMHLDANQVSANKIQCTINLTESDVRLKDVKDEYTLGIDKLNRLKIYNYTFKNNPKDKRVGVIAQELMKIFPDAVSKNKDGYYSIREEDIFYAMVNALKEFDKKIKTIADDIKNMDKLTVSLDAKIKKLAKQTEKNTNDIEKLKKDINSIEVKLRNNS